MNTIKKFIYRKEINFFMKNQRKPYSTQSKLYSCLILLVFLRNINKSSFSSIKQLTKITDKLAEKLGYNFDLTYMSKFNIVKNLIKSRFLIEEKENYKHSISLSNNIKNYFNDNFQLKK